MQVLDAARRHWGVQWRSEGPLDVVSRAAPQETAVGLSYGGRPHTVLMATPADLDDLALGFTLTEAIAEPGDIESIDVTTLDEGVLVDVRLSPTAPARRARPRNLEGRSSCGLCGVQRLADVTRPLPRVASRQGFTPKALHRAVDALGSRQELGRLTRATHAAGFATSDGELVLVREDVGRHNALDKLAGALVTARADAADGFVVVTSRCSFEMVEKVARLGCPVIVAISAPTDLAIAKANLAELTLVALARADGFTIFTRPDRLLSAESLGALEALHV